MRYKWVKVTPDKWWKIWKWPQALWVGWKLNTRAQYHKFHARHTKWTMTNLEAN